MDSWLLLDATNTVINAVLWSGDESDWSPPEGVTALPASKHPGVGIGWQRKRSKWIAPAPVEE